MNYLEAKTAGWAAEVDPADEICLIAPTLAEAQALKAELLADPDIDLPADIQWRWHNHRHAEN